jgi:hypothetical protein
MDAKTTQCEKKITDAATPIISFYKKYFEGGTAFRKLRNKNVCTKKILTGNLKYPNVFWQKQQIKNFKYER